LRFQVYQHYLYYVCRYVFACNDWIKVRRDMSKRHAKALKLETVEESQLTTAHSTLTRFLQQTIVTDDRGVCQSVFQLQDNTVIHLCVSPVSKKAGDLEIKGALSGRR